MALGHNIADGQVASTKGTIYTAGGNEMITALSIVNGHTSAVMLNVYLKRDGSNSRFLFKKNLSLPATEKAVLDCDKEKHVLESGDLIEASDGQGSVCDFLVTTIDLP